MLYRKNLYGWEQMLRIAAGLALAVYAAWALGGAWLGIALVVSGLGLAVTGVFGFCPVCAIGGRRLKPYSPARS